MGSRNYLTLAHVSALAPTVLSVAAELLQGIARAQECKADPTATATATVRPAGATGVAGTLALDSGTLALSPFARVFVTVSRDAAGGIDG